MYLQRFERKSVGLDWSLLKTYFLYVFMSFILLLRVRGDVRWERLDDWNRRSWRNACPLAAVWWTMRISKGQLSHPLAWLRSAKEISSLSSFNFRNSFFVKYYISMIRPYSTVLFRIAYSQRDSTCHSYVLTCHDQIYSANVFQRRGTKRVRFYFQNRTRVKPLTFVSSMVHLRWFLFWGREEDGNGSANKILLAHGDANTVSRADV